MATKKYERVEHYVNLPWTYQVSTTHDQDEGKLYIVCVNELPGICTDAPTIDEAMQLIAEAIEGAIESYIEHGKEIPLPLDETLYKGNIAYRTTGRRHFFIAQEAKRREMSLSKVLDAIIDQHQTKRK